MLCTEARPEEALVNGWDCCHHPSLQPEHHHLLLGCQEGPRGRSRMGSDAVCGAWRMQRAVREQGWEQGEPSVALDLGCQIWERVPQNGTQKK